MITRIALSELIATGVRLRPAEAVALVGEICRQRAARVLPGLPSPSVIRLASTGEISIEGPVPTGDDSVARAGHLLDSLLADVDAPPEYRASGALRLAIARARGTLDLPPFASLEDFCGALVRFTNLDARDVAIGLVAAYTASHVKSEPVAMDAGDVPIEPVAPRLFADVDAEGGTRARFGWWVWFGAPAAAALVGYVLALPASPETPHPPPATVAARDVNLAPAPPASPEPAAVTESAAVSEPAPVERAESAPAGPRIIQASAFSPAFAASGGVVYFHEQHDGAGVLMRGEAAADGTVHNVTSVVADRSRNFHPRPSPDGTRIAFDSDRDGVRGVYVANADGSESKRISGEGFASVPNWSPDGTRLVFVRAEPSAPRVWNLWIANADGSDLKRVTHHRVGQAWGGSWFPDGRRIAYSVETNLIILDITTGDSRVLSSPRAGFLVRTPAVSPDGSRIIFQLHRDGTWIADARTGAMSRVLADPTAEEFTWMPDGRHVAYHSHRTGNWSVWVMPL